MHKCACVCVCAVAGQLPSGSYLCVTFARDVSLSTMLPEPLNIINTHTHMGKNKQNGGWQILDVNICNMTCALQEQSACVCVCACMRKAYPWLCIHRKLGRDYADCALHNTLRVICIMRLHTLHYEDNPEATVRDLSKCQGQLEEGHRNVFSAAAHCPFDLFLTMESQKHPDIMWYQIYVRIRSAKTLMWIKLQVLIQPSYANKNKTIKQNSFYSI